jgi:hypothetical protein
MNPLPVDADLDEFDNGAALDAAVLAFFRAEVSPARHDDMTAVQRVAQAMRYGVVRADAMDAAEAEKNKNGPR